MYWYLIGACAFIVAVVVAIVLISRHASKKRFLELVRQSKEYLLKIEDFFTDLNQLSQNYITKSAEVSFENKWNQFYTEVQNKHFSTAIPEYEKISFFLKTFANLHSEIETRNNCFITEEIQKNDELLSNIDGKSLDEQQRKVVVSDEDRTLVLAGAGSGKTLTIAAKVKYLCQVKHISPEGKSFIG